MMNGTSSFIGAVLAGFATALYVSLFMLFFYFLIAGGALRTFTLVRIGLVAEIVGAFVWTLFAVSPMTLQSSA